MFYFVNHCAPCSGCTYCGHNKANHRLAVGSSNSAVRFGGVLRVLGGSQANDCISVSRHATCGLHRAHLGLLGCAKNEASASISASLSPNACACIAPLVNA